MSTAPPKNWKSLAPAPPAGTLSFGGQSALQRLPVPPLNVTLSRLKRSLKAIAWDEAEFAASERKVDQFANGLGPELQGRLEQRRDEPGRAHWLEEWWDQLAYMGYRDSVMINVSYYYGFDAHPAHYPQTTAHRAAALTRATILFRRKLKRGELSPDATKEGPLCMDTWRWMFDCCRVPAPGSDWAVTYANYNDLGDSGHIVVFRKGRPWRVDVVADGQLLSTRDLEQQFKYIYEQGSEEYPGVGVLTSSNRDIWAKNYTLLAEDPKNAFILREIHSAAFVVSLDTEKPTNVVDFSRALWHGGIHGEMLGNRWFDKPANFVIFDNNQAGVVGEHSIMDGTPMARMCDEMVEDLHSQSFDHGTPAASALPSPQPLDWNITPDILQAIASATEEGKALINTQTMGYHLTKYGKAAIKKYGVSPDSWTQMVIQLAYYRLVGARKPGGTYEAATTRRFLKGRTETIRVVTVESEAWLSAMHDSSMDDETRRKLFTEATKIHISDAREAGKAQGIDRHLLGLRLLLRDEEKEKAEIFSDPVYTRASRWTLSTSAIWSKHFPSYGWGEVVPDGFGVAYMTGHEDCLQFTVTSRTEMPNAQFVEEIARAAEDLRALFDSNAGKSKL
ncbi:carnitine acetyl transferase [Hysterangium stoloniferum]|nr:carnitine acetyl transferase [Hysterangium stoloniferum]